MTRCRVVTGVFRHPGKAVLAASTAALNSSAVVSGIRDTTSCVACDTPHPKCTRHTSTVDRSELDRSTRNQKSVSEGSSAYWVGDVDVLVGARLDELPADEEPHPRLRRGGERREARSGMRGQSGGRGGERSHA